MAKNNFDACLTRLLRHEGGYTDHPADPGGPTNYGITIHDYRRYVKANATAVDIRAMPLAHAKAIYRQKYWNALRCDDLPAGVDYAVFDYGVNSGTGRIGKVLRRVLRLPDTTSAVTDDVIAAARGKDPSDLCNAICDERIAFLKRLHTWPVFGKGWERRVAEVRAASRIMARGAMLPTPDETPGPGRAVVTATPKAERAIAAGTGSTAAAGGAGFYDWITTHPLETTIIVCAALAAIAVAVHFVRRARARSRDAAPAGWSAPIVAEAAPTET